MLPQSTDATLARILGSKARRIGCTLLACGGGVDHVHAVVHLAATVAVADLVRRLKGATAYDVNHHEFFGERLVWQDGYWAESVSPADLTPLLRYVRTQREHHDDSHPAERWQTDMAREPAAGGL